MKVTGFMIREAIRQQELKRKTASDQFGESAWTFENENKMSPDEAMTAFVAADRAMAALGVAQARYNLEVKGTISGQEMTLSEMVKLVGGAGRTEKMWRGIAADTGRDSYSRRDHERNKESEYAKRTLSQQDATKRASEAMRFAGQLRASIAQLNTKEVEIDGLDLKLFE